MNRVLKLVLLTIIGLVAFVVVMWFLAFLIVYMPVVIMPDFETDINEMSCSDLTGKYQILSYQYDVAIGWGFNEFHRPSDQIQEVMTEFYSRC